jgi:hypothetical protein
MLKSLGYATLVHGVELVDDIANLSDKSIDRMYVGDKIYQMTCHF